MSEESRSAAKLSSKLAAEAAERINRAISVALSNDKNPPEDVADLLREAQALLKASISLLDVLMVR